MKIIITHSLRFILFVLIQVFVFNQLEIGFDIRDMPIDNLKNSTLPQLLGVVNSKLVGIAFLLIFIIGNLYLGFIEPDNLLFYMAVVIQLLFLLFANHQRPFYYFTLIRIENKTYGICRVTGKKIQKERLMLVPHATLSIEAKNNEQK